MEKYKHLFLVIFTTLTLGLVLCGCPGSEPLPDTGTGTGGSGGSGGGSTSATLTTSPSGEIDIPVEGGSIKVTVTTNASSWDVKFDPSKPDWCSIAKDDANKTFTVSGDANTSADERSVKIKVTGKNAKDVSLTVKQKGAEATLAIDPVVKEIKFKADSEEQKFIFNIITNVTEWTAGFSSGIKWCKLDMDIANKKLTVTADPNKDERGRETLLVICAGDADQIRIPVVQESKDTSGGANNYDYKEETDWDED